MQVYDHTFASGQTFADAALAACLHDHDNHMQAQNYDTS